MQTTIRARRPSFTAQAVVATLPVLPVLPACSEFLESTSSFTTELRQPESVQRAGLYPKRYSIRHDTAGKVYRITLDDLTPRES